MSRVLEMSGLALRESADSPMLDSVFGVYRRGDGSTMTMLARRTFVGPGAGSMPRKLFIVARANTAAYRQLLRTVGGEPGVEIIYDRRPPPRNPGTLRRLASRVKRAFGLSRRDQALEALGRRQRTRIDQDLKANGWAVVRLDDPHDA